MKPQPKNIVDRLSNLTQMLSENKFQQNFQLYNEKRKNLKNKSPKSKNKARKKQIDEDYEVDIDELIQNQNSLQHISNFQNEIEYINIEEEEEESDSEYEENTEHISDVEDEDEVEVIQQPNPSPNSSPIRQFVIKSDAKSFVKFTYFRRWRRAFQAKQIQDTIAKKMKKYKKDDKEKENGIYRPCYDPYAFKKSTRSDQINAIERLSMPKQNHSPRPITKDKNGNQIIIHGNPQYKPKTEEERRKGQRRQIVRQIAIERDEKEHKSKPTSQKEIKKIVDRLSSPKKRQEKEPERPKHTISQQKQIEIAMRLSVPKKDPEKEEIIPKKTNKFILPTKKEQLEICTRLAQPKPDFSPKPIKHKSAMTLSEQMEICERLSGTKKTKVVKRKNDDNKINDVNNKKVNKKSKKKGKKNRKKKSKSKENDDSLTFLPNNAVFVPTASPVPTQNLPASPLIMTTPRKVRFNGFQSASKQNQNSKILSRAVNEALGETSENDSRSSIQRTQQEFSTPISDDESVQNSALVSPRVEKQQIQMDYIPRKPINSGRRASYTPTRFNQLQRNAQNNLSSDDNDINNKTNRKNAYHPIAGYRRKRRQSTSHFPSSDNGARQEEIRYPTSEDDQNSFKNESEKLQNSAEASQIESIEQIKNQSEIRISIFEEEEENIHKEIVVSSIKDQILKEEEEEEQDLLAKILNNKGKEEVEEKDTKKAKDIFDLNQIDDDDEEPTKEVKININIEEEEVFEEEEELHSHSTSLLKSSENDDDEFNPDKFYFESQQPIEMNYEEDENEKLTNDIDNDEIVHDQLFSEGDSSHFASLDRRRGLSSEIESETIKEIDKTDLDQFVKDNILTIEEEEDENDEIVINDNISGIEAHTPINGLISNSEIDIHLFSNTQESNNSDN